MRQHLGLEPKAATPQPSVSSAPCIPNADIEHLLKSSPFRRKSRISQMGMVTLSLLSQMQLPAQGFTRRTPQHFSLQRPCHPPEGVSKVLHVSRGGGRTARLPTGVAPPGLPLEPGHNIRESPLTPPMRIRLFRTSLVAQWLGIHLPMQGTGV